MKRLLCVAILLLLLAGCANAFCTPGCAVDCYDEEVCKANVQEGRKQSEIANAGCDEAREYIRENGLACDMDTHTMHPLNLGSKIYRCCYGCIEYNRTGSDRHFQVCKYDAGVR